MKNARAGRCAAVFFIAGPTAGGKTAAALALADALQQLGTGAEIVNADAMQVYRDLPVLSAQPDAQDRARARHHLLGHVGAGVRYSAGRWATEAGAAIADIAARGAAAIVVGGTGLYFRALEEGLSPVPPIPPTVRAAARLRLEEVGLEAFRRDVLALDPAMARLAPGDAQRHLRAYEVATATGKPLSSRISRWASGL